MINGLHQFTTRALVVELKNRGEEEIEPYLQDILDIYLSGVDCVDSYASVDDVILEDLEDINDHLT